MNPMFSPEFINANLMGPSALLLAEEVSAALALKPGMRVLDLACGTGLTSLYLASQYGVEVVAMDLWIAAEDNARRFSEHGLSNLITPLHMDVADLPAVKPFPENHFDALLNIDAYHYFGASSAFFDSHLAPWIKPGGRVAIVIPGLKRPFDRGVPPELAPFWQSGMNFFTVDWWRQLWQQSAYLQIAECTESARCEQAWQAWLACSHPYAIRDRDMMAAEAGHWFNFTKNRILPLILNDKGEQLTVDMSGQLISNDIDVMADGIRNGLGIGDWGLGIGDWGLGDYLNLFTNYSQTRKNLFR